MDEPRQTNESTTAGAWTPQAWSEAEEQFLREHMRRIFLLILRIVGNPADAQDLTQETFIKALQRREQLRDMAKAPHWLSRIASNTAIDFLRAHGRVQLTPIDEMGDVPHATSEPSAEQRLLREEQHDALQSALDRLTERERIALVLRDVDDMSADEVADVLQCGKATVRSHIANARTKFRAYWEGRRP